MKAIKYTFFLILIAIITASIYVAVQPNTFSITKSHKINAPTAVVYNNVNDYKNWNLWLPFAYKKHKTTKNEDTTYIWKNKNGIGTIKTLATNINKSINQTIQFTDFPPLDVLWNFNEEKDGTTTVNWTIKGENLPFNFKAHSALIGGIEKQIKPDFEPNLKLLDSIILLNMKKYSIVIDKKTTQYNGGFYIYNTTTATFQNFKSKIATMLPEVIAYAHKNNIAIAGAPYTLYHKWDKNNNIISLSCCVPTNVHTTTTDSTILTGTLKPFKAVKTTLNGNYNNLEEAWRKTKKTITESGLEQDLNGTALEVYLNTPQKTPNPADLKTEIYIKVK